MSRDDFGRQLALQLRQTEKSIDLALAQSFEQTAFMLRGRLKHRFAAAMGHDALQSMATAQAALVSARDAVVTAHGQLKTRADEIGVDYTVAAGPEDKPVEDGPRTKPMGHLVRVA